MPTATLTTAKLETIGKAKQSKYEGKPDYRPCLFKLADGNQFWKSYSVDAEELTWLQRDQDYQVAIAGDDFTIIKPSNAPTQPIAPTLQAPSAQPATVGIPASQKAAIASHATDLTKLYSFCLKQAKAELPDEDSETVRCAASAVFIALQRKFSLS